MEDALCRTIMDTARMLVAAQQVVTGDDTLHRQGPNGQWWKFRMYQNGRGYFHINVTSPDVQGIMYSVNAITRALNALCGWNEGGDAQMEDQPDNDAWEHLTTGLVISVELQHICALRIQTVYRSHRVWNTRLGRLRMLHRLSILTHQVQLITTSLMQYEGAFVISAVSEKTMMQSNPDLLIAPRPPLYVVNIPTHPNVINLLSLMSHPTGLERDALRAYAVGLVAEWGAKTVPHRCARAVLSDTPYPLLIGSLPLPSTPIFIWKSSNTDAPLFVRSGNTLHDDHRILLTTAFKHQFMEHVLYLIGTRPVGIFDFYLDRRMTKHAGSLIVSKFLARLRGNVIPVLHIESIASVNKGQGTGRRMFDFCKSLVLSDNAMYGLLLAECLKIDFWEYRMNETTEGRSMIVQLQKLYDDVCFEPLCTMRTREVRDVDESTPSPMKQSS